MKQCKVCQEEKPLSEFYKDKFDYYNPRCKACRKAAYATEKGCSSEEIRAQKPTTCVRCGGPISKVRQRSNARFCTNECRDGSYAKYTHDAPLTHPTIGAISELIVSAHLLLKGYEVFRAMSPACSCDLIINKAGAMKRIEVRSGYITMGGKVNCPFNHRDIGRSDILAIVVNDGKQIVYRDSTTMEDIEL